MRTQLITGALAVAATSALIGLGTAPGSAQTLDPKPDPMQPGTSREVGKVLECTGSAGRTPVRANLYQNKTYGNFLEVLVNDGRAGEAGASREAAKPFVVGTKVRAAARIDGTRIVIKGLARPTGEVKKVKEVVEDAGLRIVSAGTHRLLEPVLTVSYDGRTGRLTCDSAFAFNLKVTKTSIVD
ncbi:hypothetical protein ASC77_01330 [Nocardioides sp. Root1257]|uniref:hypothetical protein n=1 Tax=unclassified Nocardioides TaxID=2615069 RepID=UPI0007019B78|nr:MULTISPECIES: hypothetical protein [unclassified Nocardioides]KQW52977.1 hypothetical protein ASC77_01330 [Nocardioides sp. Root1257]KRC55665.1 hypothetical protein ASE24_01330 [Nocardioides sp. Root224]